MMNNDDKSLKGVLMARMGTLGGYITLSNEVLSLTLVYTVMQIYLTYKRIKKLDRNTTFF